MTTHIIAITYEPKIAPVQAGSCRNTWRVPNPAKPKKVGDKILIHGWEGKPYRSRWSWRLERYIWESIDVEAYADFVRFLHLECQHPLLMHPNAQTIDFPIGEYDIPWTSKKMDYEAELDGIVPVSGTQLKKVLEGFHGPFSTKPKKFQIIRW